MQLCIGICHDRVRQTIPRFPESLQAAAADHYLQMMADLSFPHATLDHSLQRLADLSLLGFRCGGREELEPSGQEFRLGAVSASSACSTLSPAGVDTSADGAEALAGGKAARTRKRRMLKKTPSSVTYVDGVCHVCSACPCFCTAVVKTFTTLDIACWYGPDGRKHYWSRLRRDDDGVLY